MTEGDERDDKDPDWPHPQPGEAPETPTHEPPPVPIEEPPESDTPPLTVGSGVLGVRLG